LEVFVSFSVLPDALTILTLVLKFVSHIAAWGRSYRMYWNGLEAFKVRHHFSIDDYKYEKNHRKP
jgi:hypothetical protein